jgi:hypothetical protein
MALLQGHLLRHKNDPEGAIRDAYQLAAERGKVTIDRSAGSAKADGGNSSGGGSAPAKPVASRGRRVLTAEEVDKMVFNPQPGWDKGITSL